MTKQEYMTNLPKQSINKAKVEIIRSTYRTNISEIVQKIVSCASESLFFDDAEARILSFAEIVDAEADLHVEFKTLGLIPLVDCGENDFIVYHFRNDTWSMFNIVDETSFKERKEFFDVLK